MAYSLVILANYFGLILSVWLGIYIVTRSRRSWLAWSTGLTLWSSAVLFANILLFIFSSPAPFSQPAWVKAILPIWPEVSGGEVVAWTQGWASGLGLLFWFHTTLLIIPGPWPAWRRWSLTVAYGFAILTLAVQIFLPHLLNVGSHDPLLVDNQSFDSIYTLYAGFFLLVCGLSVFNVLEARRLSTAFIASKQNNILLAVSLVISLATILSIIGAIPGQSIRVYWVSGLLIIAVVFLSYGVIRYSAILGHRVLRRDLAYSAVATGLAISLYLSVFAWLVRTYHVPPGIFVFLIPLVTFSHSVTEDVRHVLERLIFDRKTHFLRANLSRLAQVAVEQADLGAVLSRALETICYPVRAIYAVILVFDHEQACPSGSFRWRDEKHTLLRKDFEADDVKDISPGSLPEPFQETTLLVPLYTSQEQIGALLLGRPENAIHYSVEDLQLLEGAIDQLVQLIVKNRRINEYLDQVVQLPIQPGEAQADLIPTMWVEDALQNISDYAYLGNSPLANLKQVSALLNEPPHTHLDAGKAVRQVIARALEKLQPESVLSSGSIPREWFPYLILHDAYFDGLPNRDITSKLYISEGTFHRTRRAALRSVARVLGELETACR